jgi:hypothetical protein
MCTRKRDELVCFFIQQLSTVMQSCGLSGYIAAMQAQITANQSPCTTDSLPEHSKEAYRLDYPSIRKKNTI